ncbi:MAG: GNAT family N-acetyltransferase [Bacteroidota bacterium]
MESLEERIKRVVQEKVIIVPYNSNWPRMFEEEKKHLFDCLPREIIKRIEHFGSTAIPNLSAKPIIDILVEVPSLEETKKVVVPILIAQGYDYFWRPTHGEDGPPFYAWFLKRDVHGNRTHHIHMVESNFEHWERLFFRDYLIEHPYLVKEYQKLKLHLAGNFSNDRVTYTNAKTKFIVRVTRAAREHYNMKKSLMTRKAELSDVNAITEIYNEAILTTTATFDTEPKNSSERLQWFQSHDNRHPIWVAVLDGKVVGWISLSKWSDRPAYNDTGETSFYVKSEYRGKGIGTELLQMMIKEARQLKYHTIIARIAGESDVSLHVHENFDFVQVGILKEVGRKFGKLLDVHILQKMLD